MKLAMIVRMDNSGLGNQTRNLCEMLKPMKVLAIDMSRFNGMKQHYDWYDNYDTTYIKGMASDIEIKRFLNGVTHLFSCEIFYNPNVVKIARQMGIKTYLQYNYEFLDNLRNENLTLPDVLVAPSLWKFKEVKDLVKRKNKRIGSKYDLVYLPPPLNPPEFKDNVLTNMARETDKAKFLHVVGKPAIHQRNGTDTIYEAMEYSHHDFDLVVKSQYPLEEYQDDRITYDYSSPDQAYELYRGFDALILPRKFGGLCLPMNEALMSGLPVIMTDIEPNNKTLPKEWLVPAKKAGSFMARTMIDLYTADPQALADKMSWFAKRSNEGKQKALDLGVKNFSVHNLVDKYRKLFK